jgi:hypothetical protein
LIANPAHDTVPTFVMIGPVEPDVKQIDGLYFEPDESGRRMRKRGAAGAEVRNLGNPSGFHEDVLWHVHRHQHVRHIERFGDLEMSPSISCATT